MTRDLFTLTLSVEDVIFLVAGVSMALGLLLGAWNERGRP